MYFNARSVFRKLDNSKLVCAIHHPDVICIVESWLDKEISDSELSLDCYNVSRVDRNRRGGGVLIFVILYGGLYNNIPLTDIHASGPAILILYQW